MKKTKTDKKFSELTAPDNPAQQPPKGSGYMHPKSEQMDHEKMNDKMAKGLGC